MVSKIFSSVKKVKEKGLDGVPKSKEWSTQTLSGADFRFSAQAKYIDCYASSIGLGGKNSSNVEISESLVLSLKLDRVEEIM